MISPIRATTTPSSSLPAQLEQIGLHALAVEVDDFLARATKQRWSPRQILEHLAQTETAERAHRSLERRLRLSEIKKFKPMDDFDWSWPTKIEREVIERALTLDFLPEARNLIVVGTNGLGKTMIAQNICHQAVLAGHSVLFRSAAALLEELRLYDDHVPLRVVETALLLGSLRRLIRPADAPRLSPIRSLAYFRPVVDELRAHPAPEGYPDYLRLKLRQAATALPASVQKSTLSDDR